MAACVEAVRSTYSPYLTLLVMAHILKCPLIKENKQASLPCVRSVSGCNKATLIIASAVGKIADEHRQTSRTTFVRGCLQVKTPSMQNDGESGTLKNDVKLAQPPGLYLTEDGARSGR